MVPDRGHHLCVSEPDEVVEDDRNGPLGFHDLERDDKATGVRGVTVTDRLEQSRRCHPLGRLVEIRNRDSLANFESAELLDVFRRIPACAHHLQFTQFQAGPWWQLALRGPVSLTRESNEEE